jgi:hypothetical protein
MTVDERKDEASQFTSEVTPPRAFWRWPWHDWNRWEKCWMAIRLFANPLLAIAGLITALTLLVQFAPGTWDKIFWRPVEYSILKQLHAGYSIDYVKSKLGEPALVNSSSTVPGYRELTFVRRDYFVQTIVSGSGRVEGLTIVSCSPDFKPTFNAPDRSQVMLQAVPLAQAQIDIQANSHDTSTNKDLNDGRILYYFPGLTVSSIDQYLEAGSFNGSNFQESRSFYVGISSLCIETANYQTIFHLGGKVYSGPASDAPTNVAIIRRRVAANLYSELASPSYLILADDGRLALTPPGYQYGTTLVSGSFTVGPYWGDVPRVLRNAAGTQIFK